MKKTTTIALAVLLSSTASFASVSAPASKKLAGGEVSLSETVAATHREVRDEGMSVTVTYSIPEALVTPVGTDGLMKCTLDDFSTIEDPDLPALPVRYDAFENMSSGVYVVALVVDGAVVDTKKVVVK